MSAIKDYDTLELLRNGVHVGFLIQNKNEIHFYLTKEKALKYSVWLLRRVVKPLLEKYSELITFSPCNNDSFLLRAGFVSCGMVGKMHKLVLTKIKLKGTKCHL